MKSRAVDEDAAKKRTNTNGKTHLEDLQINHWHVNVKQQHMLFSASPVSVARCWHREKVSGNVDSLCSSFLE